MRIILLMEWTDPFASETVNKPPVGKRVSIVRGITSRPRTANLFLEGKPAFSSNLRYVTEWTPDVLYNGKSVPLRVWEKGEEVS